MEDGLVLTAILVLLSILVLILVVMEDGLVPTSEEFEFLDRAKS